MAKRPRLSLTVDLDVYKRLQEKANVAGTSLAEQARYELRRILDVKKPTVNEEEDQ